MRLSATCWCLGVCWVGRAVSLSLPFSTMLSYPAPPCFFVSCRVMSCPVVSCRLLSFFDTPPPSPPVLQPPCHHWRVYLQCCARQGSLLLQQGVSVCVGGNLNFFGGAGREGLAVGWWGELVVPLPFPCKGGLGLVCRTPPASTYACTPVRARCLVTLLLLVADPMFLL